MLQLIQKHFPRSLTHMDQADRKKLLLRVHSGVAQTACCEVTQVACA